MVAKKANAPIWQPGHLLTEKLAAQTAVTSGLPMGTVACLALRGYQHVLQRLTINYNTEPIP
jgi:hypothetical protein